jgi:hypothetical protein
MPGASCQGDNYTTIQFAEQGPDVTPSVEFASEIPNADISLAKLPTSPVALALTHGDTAVNTNPFTEGIAFPYLNPGIQVCMLGTSATAAFRCWCRPFAGTTASLHLCRTLISDKSGAEMVISDAKMRDVVT